MVRTRKPAAARGKNALLRKVHIMKKMIEVHQQLIREIDHMENEIDELKSQCEELFTAIDSGTILPEFECGFTAHTRSDDYSCGDAE